MEHISRCMQEDHARLDGLFEEFQRMVTKDVEGAKALFSTFKRNLQRHIVWEEELLFPAFEERAGMVDHGPTAVMRIEHRHIKRSLEAIHDGLVAGHVPPHLSETLIDMLRVHNRKEETVLYRWIDDMMSAAEATDLLGRMQTLPVEHYDQCCTSHAAGEP